MVYLLVNETWAPSGEIDFRLEKWVPEEDLGYYSHNGNGSNGDLRWRVAPYYKVYKADGTELMDTTDWNHVRGFLQAVVGEDMVSSDFQI